MNTTRKLALENVNMFIINENESKIPIRFVSFQHSINNPLKMTIDVNKDFSWNLQKPIVICVIPWGINIIFYIEKAIEFEDFLSLCLISLQGGSKKFKVFPKQTYHNLIKNNFNEIVHESVLIELNNEVEIPWIQYKETDLDFILYVFRRSFKNIFIYNEISLANKEKTILNLHIENLEISEEPVEYYNFFHQSLDYPSLPVYYNYEHNRNFMPYSKNSIKELDNYYSKLQFIKIIKGYVDSFIKLGSIIHVNKEEFVVFDLSYDNQKFYFQASLNDFPPIKPKERKYEKEFGIVSINTSNYFKNSDDFYENLGVPNNNNYEVGSISETGEIPIRFVADIESSVLLVRCITPSSQNNSGIFISPYRNNDLVLIGFVNDIPIIEGCVLNGETKLGHRFPVNYEEVEKQMVEDKKAMDQTVESIKQVNKANQEARSSMQKEKENNINEALENIKKSQEDSKIIEEKSEDKQKHHMELLSFSWMALNIKDPIYLASKFYQWKQAKKKKKEEEKKKKEQDILKKFQFPIPKPKMLPQPQKAIVAKAVQIPHENLHGQIIDYEQIGFMTNINQADDVLSLIDSKSKRSLLLFSSDKKNKEPQSIQNQSGNTIDNSFNDAKAKMHLSSSTIFMETEKLLIRLPGELGDMSITSEKGNLIINFEEGNISFNTKNFIVNAKENILLNSGVNTNICAGMAVEITATGDLSLAAGGMIEIAATASLIVASLSTNMDFGVKIENAGTNITNSVLTNLNTSTLITNTLLYSLNAATWSVISLLISLVTAISFSVITATFFITSALTFITGIVTIMGFLGVLGLYGFLGAGAIAGLAAIGGGGFFFF